MNKLLIILLAGCLISVHAFVKRDAVPAKSATVLEDLTKQFEDFKTKMAVNFEPEHIKKEFNEFVEKVNSFVNNMKPNADAPK